MSITYTKKSTLGRPSQVLVKSGPVTVGYISKHNDQFRYYEPISNELNPLFSAPSLRELKTKIEAHRK